MRIAPGVRVPGSIFLGLALAAAGVTASAAAPPAAAAAGLAAGGWNQFGYAATHNGFNPRETALTTANVGRLAVRWSASVGPDNMITGSPTVSGGRVFVQAIDGSLTAFQASNGRKLWSTAVGASASATGPSIWRTSVIAAAVGADNGAIVGAYDAKTGARHWQTPLGGQGWVAMPIVSGDSIYLSTGLDVYRISAQTGRVRWQTAVATDPEYSGVWGPVAVSGDGSQVVAATTDGWVIDLATANGAIRWQTRAGGGIYRGGPAIAGGIAYVPEGGSSAEGGGFDIVALRLSDGVALWRSYAGDDVHVVPSIGQGVIVVGAIDTGFRALDAATGATRWAIEWTPEVWSSVAIANGVGYAATESSFFAVDLRTGRELFTTDIGGGYANMASPAVWGGRVYVGSGEGVIRAFGLR